MRLYFQVLRAIVGFIWAVLCLMAFVAACFFDSMHPTPSEFAGHLAVGVAALFGAAGGVWLVVREIVGKG